MNANIASLDNLIEKAVGVVDPHNSLPSFEKMLRHMMPSDHPYAQTHFLVPKLFAILEPTAAKEDSKKAGTLGWIFQLFQANHYLIDDLVDGDGKRYGRPTWAHLNNYDMCTVTQDFRIMESSAYILLEKMFGKHPRYLDIVNIFRQAQTEAARGNRKEIGHRLTCKTERSDLGHDMKAYEEIAAAKAALYIKLPVLLALSISTQFEILRNQGIWLIMNDLFQKFGVWASGYDDYFDIFSHHANNDEKFTDIKRGQFTILLVFIKHLCKSIRDWEHFLSLREKQDYTSLKAFIEKLGVPEMFCCYRVKLEREISGSIEIDFKNHDALANVFDWLFTWFKKIISVDVEGDENVEP